MPERPESIHHQIAGEAISYHSRGNLFFEVYESVLDRNFTADELTRLINTIGITPSEFAQTVGGNWHQVEGDLNMSRGTFQYQLLTQEEGKQLKDLVVAQVEPIDLDLADVNRRMEISMVGGYLLGFYKIQEERDWDSALKKLDQLFPGNSEFIRRLLYASLVQALILDGYFAKQDVEIVKIWKENFPRSRNQPQRPRVSREEWYDLRKKEWKTPSD